MFYNSVKCINVITLKRIQFAFCHLSMWHHIYATSWENLFMPYANYKGADQSAHPRSLISDFDVRGLDSIIILVTVSEIWSLYLVSVAAQACLSLPWSKIPKTGFPVMGLK